MGSVGGPIKREQDEINRGASFPWICPAEFSLAKEEMRKTQKVFYNNGTAFFSVTIYSFSQSSFKFKLFLSDSLYMHDSSKSEPNVPFGVVKNSKMSKI